MSISNNIWDNSTSKCIDYIVVVNIFKILKSPLNFKHFAEFFKE